MADKPIDPGDLSKRVVWARREKNSQGHIGTKTGPQAEYLFPVVGTYWAKIETLSWAEVYAAAQLRATADSRIIMFDNIGAVQPGDTLTVVGNRPKTYVVASAGRHNEQPAYQEIKATAAVAP